MNQDVDAKDVLSSHVYGSAARNSNAVPSRPILQPRRQSGRGYKDSMVGSLSQYRTAPNEQPKVADTPDTGSDAPIVGNRAPHSGVESGKPGSNSIERRKHFIEPPKRGFHPYN